MLKEDVLAHFGSPKAVAMALGLTRAAIRQWGDVVPLERAVMLEQASYGKLKVDLGYYDRGGKPIMRKLA